MKGVNNRNAKEHAICGNIVTAELAMPEAMSSQISVKIENLDITLPDVFSFSKGLDTTEDAMHSGTNNCSPIFLVFF